jgi:hypothetical protein
VFKVELSEISHYVLVVSTEATMEDREVRVTPHCLQWSAYYPDSPHERTIGDSPVDAMQRLRELAKVREEELAIQRHVSVVTQRKRNAAVFASVLLVGLITTAFIVQATANSTRKHIVTKIYAHRVMHTTAHHHSGHHLQSTREIAK